MMTAKTIYPPKAQHMPFDIWKSYIQTINLKINSTQIKTSLVLKTIPGVVDLNPVWIIQGSFKSELVDHIQKETGIRYPQLGNLIFDSLHVNGKWFVVINRHLLMDAIMDQKIKSLSDFLKLDVYLFVRTILSNKISQYTINPTRKIKDLYEISDQILSQIIKTLDV